MAEDRLEFLQAWYAAQCDGDWEHQHGIEIGTLDNPGWRIAVDLEGTDLAGRRLERRVLERTEQDWWHAWSDGERFHAAAGSHNLGEVLEEFRHFVEDATDSSD